MDDATWERLMAADRLLLYGLLDQAEQAYAGILGDRPSTSEAAFGLARVALERGDEELAYERVAKAVELNPRNDDAQRLYQRLAEIRATRRAAQPQQREQAVRPSEQSAFARNRSMADHAADEERRKRT